MPQVFLDGNYLTDQPAGPVTYEQPFKDDPVPYSYKVPYWTRVFTEPAIGSPGPFGGYYVGLVIGSIKPIGGTVYELVREFAIVPRTRNEYGSYVYDYHLAFFTLGLPNFCLQGAPLLCHSRIQFDYFRTADPGSIDLPRHGQIFSTCIGGCVLGEFPDGNTPSGTEILAEDATFKTWKPGIYERQMRFIKWINAEDLFFGGS